MLTILIATRNGEKTLPMTLGSLCHQSLSQSDWKLVVVDNGSTDSTYETLTSFSNRLPLTILREPIAGKNRALNQGMKHIEGDLVLFSDDDVIFNEGWISAHRSAADTFAEFDIFTGPILPLWPSAPSSWILKNVPLAITYAITKGEPAEGECSIGVVWGPNFSVRKSTLESYGLLPENIGPSGNNYAMGSESSFLYKLAQLGHRSYFIQHASVDHIIRPHQMKREWTLDRAYRFGRGACKLQQLNVGESAKEFFGMPRWVVRQLAQSYALRLAALGSSDKAYKHEWQIRYLQGFIYEYRSEQCLRPPEPKPK